MYQQYELRPEFELESKSFQDILFPPHVVQHVYEVMKVQQQIAGGNRNSRNLVNYVFFLRHPDLQGKVKPETDKNHKPEWEQIFFNVVAPTLNSWTPPPGSVKPPPPGSSRGIPLTEVWSVLKWFFKHTGRP